MKSTPILNSIHSKQRSLLIALTYCLLSDRWMKLFCTNIPIYVLNLRYSRAMMCRNIQRYKIILTFPPPFFANLILLSAERAWILQWRRATYTSSVIFACQWHSNRFHFCCIISQSSCMNGWILELSLSRRSLPVIFKSRIQPTQVVQTSKF